MQHLEVSGAVRHIYVIRQLRSKIVKITNAATTCFGSHRTIIVITTRTLVPDM